MQLRGKYSSSFNGQTLVPMKMCEGSEFQIQNQTDVIPIYKTLTPMLVNDKYK